MHQSFTRLCNPPTDRRDIIAPLAFVLSVVSGYLNQGWSILAVELELPILDANGIEITHGTVYTVTPKTLLILAGSESDGAEVTRVSAPVKQTGGSRYCGIERQKREVSGVKYFVRL
jgi:hypothetical protein